MNKKKKGREAQVETSKSILNDKYSYLLMLVEIQKLQL